ncbi:MAG: lytic murein transglycosylase [Actinomycetota bacterium]
MRRLRLIVATAVLGVALSAQYAAAQDSLSSSPPAGTPPPTGPTNSTSVTVEPVPAPPAPAPPKPKPKKPKPKKPSGSHPQNDAAPGKSKNGGTQVAGPGDALDKGGPTFGDLATPAYPAVSCGDGQAAAAPAGLLPIYQRASDAYGLGPQGPSVLAAINQIESGFGANMGPSSAGAIGWMQFMPSTWESYGVDGDGDGDRDPYDPEDAIFAAARYLSASGMPEDTPGAIFSYNHADWYVAEVLAAAGCFGTFDGTIFSLAPELPVLACSPADDAREEIPERYLQAFERAAARFELDEQGVWAMAAVARLESNYGRGMTRDELRTRGPLGLDADEWRRFAMDGNRDGRIRHADIEDSAATLARELWSRGGVRPGLFLHNQASWYVQEASDEAERISGHCRKRTSEWSVLLPQASSAPVKWANVQLSNDLERRDIATGALDPRIMGLIGAISRDHTVTISALRSDHDMNTVDGNISNHYFGRAMDISAVDGVPCTDTLPDAPCAVLGRTLTLLPAPSHPTELIYCFDLDGPGPAFARADHCDHLHIGYDS